MKLRLETIYRSLLIGLVLLVCWSAWAASQPPVPAAATNAPSAPAAADGDLPGLMGLNEDFLTFGLNQVGLLQEHQVLGEPLWKYVASLIYIFLAFYISKFLDFLTRVWLKRWAEKTESRLDDLLLDLLNGPVKVVSFVVLLHLGLGVFRWPAKIEEFLSKGLIVVVACSITYLVLKLVDVLLGYWRSKTSGDGDKSFDEQLFPIIRKSLKVFIVTVAVLVTSQNLGFNITAVIASLSIGGLALGLAAQDTLANLFGAVAVFIDKPFRVGDRIQLDAVDGIVETIGLRSTRVRNLDGFLVTVPNKTMGNATITNVSLRPTIKTVLNIGVTYDTPAVRVKRAAQLLEEICRAHPMTHDVLIGFDKFADSSLNLTLIHWWNSTDYKAYLAGLQEINLEIKRRFDEEGIAFAFPTRTLYVKQDSAWNLGNQSMTPPPPIST